MLSWTMKLKGGVLLSFLAAICSAVANGDTAQCYSCEDLPHPRDCLRVTTCSPGDVCYTEEVVTSSGNILFHTGCMPRNRCSVSTPVIGKRAGDLTLCIDCCQDDFCNNQGCGKADLPLNQRGPYCFNCDATWEGQKCEKIITCGVDEICAIHTPRDYFNVPEIIYKSSCMPKPTCAALQTAYITTKCVPTCCDTDYCNTHCNNSSPHLTPAPTTLPPITHPPTTTQPPTTTSIPCPSSHNYDPVSGLCIKIMHVAHAVSWHSAQDACLAMGDSLVSIDSQQKTAFINSLIKGMDSDWFWIGGRDQYDNSTFYWSNGNTFGYTNWGGGDDVSSNQQPDDGSGAKQDCVGIYSKDYHKWHDHHCYSMEMDFICEHNPRTTTLNFPFTCEESDGYIDLGGGLCVHIHRDKSLDWNHARARCRHELTDLVVLDTAAKINTLNAYLDIHDKTRKFYIGGYDQHKNNKFYWITGQLFTATNWYKGSNGTHAQPDNIDSDGNTEDCVTTYPYYSPHHMWHDVECSKHFMFICQRT